MKNLFILLVACFFWSMCNNPTHRQESVSSAAIQMTLMSSGATGIDFANMVPYNDTFNCYTFRNFYNGGGVGVGDINNDGLLDVFYCGNMSPNRLYLNLGNWKFKDITESCGMGLSKTWTAGVAFADVNGDGWLDIYICNAGIDKWKKKQGNALSRLAQTRHPHLPSRKLRQWRYRRFCRATSPWSRDARRP